MAQKHLSFWAKVGISAAATLAVSQLVRRAKLTKLDLRGKVVLITGARGLALALAREFGHQGARVVLCARDSDELEKTSKSLNGENIETACFPCDISVRSEIQPLVDAVLERFGKIDILINNAGAIQVGPLDAFEHSDFEQAMNLMFWAPVNLTLAVLPEMLKNGGHIINIGSVGGRVSIPHLLPYCCAKFAVVGFSTGLTAELRSSGIRVLTVIPGLMRTGSYLNVTFAGEAKREFAWFGILGNLPGFSVAADYAARCIRRAFENNQNVCTISLPAKLLIACEALLPNTLREILTLTNCFLLPGGSGKKQTAKGHDLNRETGWLFQALTALGKQAAQALNEQ